MKKISKFLSVVLAACMIFGMLPALTVSAADAADPVSVKIDAPEVVPLYKDESYSYAERGVKRRAGTYLMVRQECMRPRNYKNVTRQGHK